MGKVSGGVRSCLKWKFFDGPDEPNIRPQGPKLHHFTTDQESTNANDVADLEHEGECPHIADGCESGVDIDDDETAEEITGLEEYTHLL